MDSLESESIDLFFPNWPMFIAVIDRGQESITTTNLPRIAADDEPYFFVPIFSEPDFAERWINENRPDAIARELPDARSLFYTAKAIFESGVADGYAIDPGFTAKPTGLLFREILAQVMGDDFEKLYGDD